MFVAETMMFVAIACTERHKVEDRVIHFTSCSPTISFTNAAPTVSQVLPAKSVEQAVTEALSSIAYVKKVQIERENGEFLVSIMASASDKDARYAIYDRQFSLMEEFPKAIFDFRLIQVA